MAERSDFLRNGPSWVATGMQVRSAFPAKCIIVADAIYDRFLEIYKKGVSKLKAGDPMDPFTTLAPLCSQGAADDLRRQVENARAFPL